MSVCSEGGEAWKKRNVFSDEPKNKLDTHSANDLVVLVTSIVILIDYIYGFHGLHGWYGKGGRMLLKVHLEREMCMSRIWF